MKRKWITFLIVLLLSVVYAGNTRTIKDKDIVTTIESELIFDPIVDFNSVDVACENGIVTLRGKVKNIKSKERAEKIAAALVGVRAIVNFIGVDSKKISDMDLEDAVSIALLHNPATESFEISVLAKDGRVILGGVVHSWQEKSLASSVAKGIMGVRSVENNILVEHLPKRSDFEIENDIKERMANDVLVDDILVNVKVKRGNVILSGKVSSLAEKNRAIQDAYVGTFAFQKLPYNIFI